MTTTIMPPQVRQSRVSAMITDAGFDLIHQGKVRDTFALDDEHLLQLTTDRVSTHDIVHPYTVDGMGAALVALNHLGRADLDAAGLRHDLVGFGIGRHAQSLTNWLPPALCADRELIRQVVVVRRAEQVPAEAIARGYSTGSLQRFINEHPGEPFYGHQLPEGLKDGDELPEHIFTPSTKAATGHDETVSYDDYVAIVGLQVAAWTRTATLDAYLTWTRSLAKAGYIIADTKIEFGWVDGALVITDETCTIHSSRFWDKEERRQALAEGRPPKSFDKEELRKAMEEVETPFGCPFNKLKPENPDHMAWVANDMTTTSAMSAAFETMMQRGEMVLTARTGLTLAEYQQQCMFCP